MNVIGRWYFASRKTIQDMNRKRRIKSVIKNVLYFLLYSLRFFDLLIKILTKIRKQHPCIILNYHRIVDDNSRYLSKGPVVHHHLKHFKKEIPYLNKNYRILSMDEVVRCMKSGLGFRKPSVAITFDDGYLDNYTLAYPVLKRHRAPATIYLATGLIGTLERTWTDQIELALLETKKDRFILPELFSNETLRIRTKEEGEQVNIKVAEALKLRPDEERRELMRNLFKILELDYTCRSNLKSRMMLNWGEVQKMAQNGITIGAHSHTHPILSRMPPHEAKKDIFISKKTIEENLGIKVKHFAFPNGREEDFTEELRDYCRKIGFESIASVVYGMNNGQNGSVMNLKRIGARSPVWLMAGELFKGMIHFYRMPKNGKRFTP